MVSIDICKGLWGKVSVTDTETKKELWQGKSGQTASFAVDGEKQITMIWGIFQTPNLKETVKDGGEYELICRIRPFGAEYSLISKEEIRE